jgi:type I restriction enzyme, S subunit
LSELPDGWETVLLGELGEWGSGGTPKRTNPRYYEGGTIPWLIIGDLNDDTVNSARTHITEDGLLSSSTKLLPINTLLIAMYGSIGKLGITGVECATNQAIAFCKPNTDMVSLKYLFYCLMESKNALIAQGQGGAQQNISQGILKAHPVPLAPLNEQKRIADKLDALLARVDACRERLDRVPLILKRFRQAVLAAATSGQLTEDWRAERVDRRNNAILDSTLIPLGYELIRLGSLVQEPLRNGKSVRDGEGNLVLRLSCLKNGRVDWTEAKRGSWDGIDVSRFLVKGGDFLVARGNGSRDLVGRGALVVGVPPTVAFPDTMIRVRPDKSLILPRYLQLFWDTKEVRDQIELTARTTAGIWKIAQSDLEKLLLPVPEIDEQQEIVRRVEALFAFADRLDTRYKAARAQVEQLTPALLAKAFRGELVPQDPNDEPASVLLERIRAARVVAEGNGAKPRRRKTDKSSKAEVIVSNRKEVQPSHLPDILTTRDPLTAEALFSASQLELNIDDSAV